MAEQVIYERVDFSKLDKLGNSVARQLLYSYI